MHRVSGPSGHRRTLRDKAKAESSAMRPKKSTVIRDKSDVRNKTVMGLVTPGITTSTPTLSTGPALSAGRTSSRILSSTLSTRAFIEQGKATSESTEDLVARLNAELCPA